MDVFLVHSLVLTVLVVALKRFYRKRNEPLVIFFTPAFCFKILMGVAYGWLYLFYYGDGDSFSYFRDAAILAHYASQDFWGYLQLLAFTEYTLIPGINPELWEQPRVILMVKLASLVNLLTANNYWIGGFYFSFLSFWGMWNLANTLSRFYPNTHLSAALAFLFVPSVVFWSSGYTKESITLFLLGWSLSFFLKAVHQKLNWLQWLGYGFFWMISAYLLLAIKFYYLAALLPCLLAYAFSSVGLPSFSERFRSYFASFFSQSLVWILFFFFIALLATRLHYTLNLSYIMLAIIYNHNSSYIFSLPEDLIHYSIAGGQGYITLHSTFSCFLVNSPIALFAALFRPFVCESHGSWLKWLMGMENLAVLVLTLYAILYLFRNARLTEQHLLQRKKLLLLSALMYIACLYTLLALASPNFGSLVRYKTGASPIYFYLILIPFEQLLYKIKKANPVV